MHKWNAVVVPFFAFGGLFSYVSYQMLQNMKESRPIWMVLLQWVVFIALPIMFAQFGRMLPPKEAAKFTISTALGSGIGLLAAAFYPSWEFASNVALGGLGVAAPWLVIGGWSFLRGLRK